MHVYIDEKLIYKYIYKLTYISLTLPDLTLVRSVLDSTSGNTFPPTISVLRCVESIFPRQFQYSQVFADGLRPIFPRSSSSPFSPRSPVQHLFGCSIHVHSGHAHDPTTSVFSF